MQFNMALIIGKPVFDFLAEMQNTLANMNNAVILLRNPYFMSLGVGVFNV